MFGHMKDPVLGTATVSDWKAVSGSGLAGVKRPGYEVTLEAQVVVEAEGLEPTVVQWITNFPESELPLHVGSVIPVTVDRRNPQHLKLAPDFAAQAKQAATEAQAAQAQQSRDQAQRLAASLRDGNAPPTSSTPLAAAGTGGAGGSDGEVQVLSGDAASEMLGTLFGPGGADAIAGLRARGDAEAAGAGRTTERLAKLQALKDSGILTEAEYQAQRQKIIDAI